MEIKFLKQPIYTSNYFIANNANYGEWFIGSYGWAWMFNTIKKNKLYWGFFFFLVVNNLGGIKQLARLAVKFNSLNNIEKINKLITLANQRYFFETQKEPKDWICGTIALKGFSVAMLTLEDVEELKKDKDFELYQSNLNLFQGFYPNDFMESLDLGLPSLVFPNEFIASISYLHKIEKVLQPTVKNSKSTTKLFKDYTYLSTLKTLIQKDFEFHVNNIAQRGIAVAKWVFYSLNNLDFKKELQFAYFQKMNSYFKYIQDFSSLLTDIQQANVHATLYPLSNVWVNETTSFNQMLEYAKDKIDEQSLTLLEGIKSHLQGGQQIENHEFFQTDIEKPLKYPQNLFKPSYWYDGLPDFLFNTNAKYRWDNEKETLIKPLFEQNKHFKNGNEDDNILRYIAYRGFIERCLQIPEFDFMQDKEVAKRFLQLWSKIPKKYEQLFEDSKKKIEEHTLDLIEFKHNLLNYLDEDQKKCLDKFWDKVLKYKSSLPRGKRVQDENWKSHREPVEENVKKDYALTFAEYILQIEYEFFTIAYLNFSGYFNITFDYILFAKLHNIAVWPGRWSAAGSIIAYLTYITDIDSIQYDLLFERMLHILKDPYDVPDVDSDFAPDDRYTIIEYVKKKFWENNVAHVGSYLSTSLKGMIKDLTRGWAVPYENINMITKALGSKDDEVQSNFNQMLEYYEWADVDLPWDVIAILGKWKAQLKPMLQIVKELTGYPKIPGIHACGVIISPVPIEVLSPCRYLPENKAKIWYFDKNEMEAWGLLKYDFLGLNNMQIIKRTIQSILWKTPELRKKYNINIPDKEEERTSEDWDNLDWYAMYYDIINSIGKDDDDVYENVFQMGNSTWVFQFESDGMRRVLKGIKPDCITELGDLNALYRPWPMQYIDDYKWGKLEGTTLSIYSEGFIQEMEAKYGKEETMKNVAFFEDVWSSISLNTKNILVYQEQLMSFFNKLGHSYTDADFIRKIFSKIKGGKKSFKDLEKYYNKTISILNEKGIKQDFFDYIYYEILVDWASYGFNKSHSACYSVIAYITGWLKAKYPYHFYSTLLRDFESEPTKVAKIINEMNILGIDIVWPNLMTSLKHAILRSK